MKKCPYCAEEIQDEAIVCRYCGRAFPPKPVRSPAPASPKNPEPRKKSKHGDVPYVFVAIFAGFCILSIVIIYLLPSLNSEASAQPAPTTIPTTFSIKMPTDTKVSYLSALITSYQTPTFTFRPIKWMQLAAFLSDDHTNWNKYVTDYYVCLDFSIDLVAHARMKNIKAWIVAMEFYNQQNGHAIVAFDTTDLGVVYIEPQLDYRYVPPKIGQPLVDNSTGYQYPMGRVSSIEYLQCPSSINCTPFTP